MRFVNPFRKRSKKGTDRFRVRVEPFDSQNTYYCIRYSFDNGLTWLRYERNDLHSSDPTLCRVDQPYLYRNFDQAVEIAKGLTAEGMRAHRAKQTEEYAVEMKKKHDLIRQRDRTFFT